MGPAAHAGHRCVARRPHRVPVRLRRRAVPRVTSSRSSCSAGLVGLQGLFATHGRRRRARLHSAGRGRRSSSLAAFGVWVNVVAQRRVPTTVGSGRRTPTSSSGFVGFQHDLADLLGVGDLTVERGDALPDGTGRAGTLFVVGDCDGLYLSDGLPTNAVKRSPWTPLELGPDRHLVADVPSSASRWARSSRSRASATARWPLAGSTGTTGLPLPSAEWGPRGGRPGARSSPVAGTGSTSRADDRVEELAVRLDDARVLGAFVTGRTAPVALPRASATRRGPTGVSTAFPGELRRRSVSTPLCEELLASLDTPMTTATAPAPTDPPAAGTPPVPADPPTARPPPPGVRMLPVGEPRRRTARDVRAGVVRDARRLGLLRHAAVRRLLRRAGALAVPRPLGHAGRRALVRALQHRRPLLHLLRADARRSCACRCCCSPTGSTAGSAGCR